MNTPVIILAGLALVITGFYALRRFESMRNKSSEELRAILHGQDWLFYRNALLELRRRGEDIRQEVMPVLNLLVADSRQLRIGGWLILRQVYPELASRVPEYNPREALDVCKEKMQKIFELRD